MPRRHRRSGHGPPLYRASMLGAVGADGAGSISISCPDHKIGAMAALTGTVQGSTPNAMRIAREAR